MDEKILLSIISGDGNEEEGLITTYFNTTDKNGIPFYRYNKNNISEFINKYNELNNTFIDYKHIDLMKHYLKNYRKNIFSDVILNKYKSNNEFELFKLFVEMGNVIIQNSIVTMIIYMPSNISDSVKESLRLINELFSDKMVSVVTYDSYNKNNKKHHYQNYDDFINNYINLNGGNYGKQY